MRRIIRNILFTCACMMAVSCGGDSIDELLDNAENIIVQKPDAALKMLDSIRNTIKSVIAILIFVTVIFLFFLHIRNSKRRLENEKLRQSLSESENKINSLLVENEKLQQSLSECESKVNSLLIENEKLRQLLSESENKLQQSLFECEDKFKSLLIENEKLTKRIIELYKKACSSVYHIEVKSKETSIAVQRVAGIIFQKDRWGSINYTLDTLFENIRKQTSKYELKDIYFKTVCLIYIDFSNTEISAVLKMSANTVQQTKTEIRKKLGMDPGAKIKDFVSNLIKDMQ